MTASDRPTVLILGGGINGCALARELALNGVGVCLADRIDLAAGATSKASRLIHGGLRYLEYGDVRLVRESLAERARFLELAPHLVSPLRLSIPLGSRWSGMLRSALTITGIGRTAIGQRLARSKGRGLLPVRVGLAFYDLLSSGDALPSSDCRRIGDGDGGPRVDPDRYRWICSYSDAWMLYPERFAVELLEDARRLAAANGTPFDVFTHAEVDRSGRRVTVRAGGRSIGLEPAAAVNASGAWGDRTLGALHVDGPRLFGGTKGSHFITYRPEVRAAIGDGAIYAEAPDGRLVFVLPFREGGVLVGTTDVRFEGPPEEAIASEEELDYLLGMAGGVLGLRLDRGDVALHYCGVRPLPYAPEGSAGAVTRDHSIAERTVDGLPVLTLVGGKLTTARAFAELAADRLFGRLGMERRRDSRSRPLPGAEGHPIDPEALRGRQRELAGRTGLGVEQVAAAWSLLGGRTPEALEGGGSGVLDGTDLPRSAARWIIDREWVDRLEDAVERRLMLVFEPGLTVACLREVAELLVDAGRLDADAETSRPRSPASSTGWPCITAGGSPRPPRLAEPGVFNRPRRGDNGRRPGLPARSDFPPPSRAGPMSRRLFIGPAVALAIALATPAAVAAPHPFHVTIAEADYNEESGKLEVALRIYNPGDLEEALGRRAGERVDLERTENVDDLIVAYLRGRPDRRAARRRGDGHRVGRQGGDGEDDLALLRDPAAGRPRGRDLHQHAPVRGRARPGEHDGLRPRRGAGLAPLHPRRADPDLPPPRAGAGARARRPTLSRHGGCLVLGRADRPEGRRPPSEPDRCRRAATSPGIRTPSPRFTRPSPRS